MDGFFCLQIQGLQREIGSMKTQIDLLEEGRDSHLKECRGLLKSIQDTRTELQEEKNKCEDLEREVCFCSQF